MAKEAEAGSEEPIEINIEMPAGSSRTIKYSPRHLLALKQAFKVFTKE